ncbi:hypothetical protein R2601_01523 [Salipiger bermudensis HTCC2601]|uniref:Helix-turn-helix domain-containing protein n=1 Tax=Salipiger bermudensis (strain DSM 26914 / JCM 13377 / KCTC 12554 / HTCC2601) TaxID=314265 RepID=Q0FPS7_SALBH|nr:hypothetical protein R2601_01523 [Salipiger bermudensis HTCC2601]
MTNSTLSTATNIDPLPEVREAADLLSISVPTFWRRVADGSIPKPIKLGSASRWAQSDILTVIDQAKARR